ncbi:MAG TPA: gephyrin-like molybdotransferase Glp [Verrucomicrobiae bacterium]|nr:gephyrin-like molybdotransferase Glp [Verrucomicrobiae bacterium]
MTTPLPSVATARARVLAGIDRLDSERVALTARLVGRVLAAPVVATVRLPPFANSGMDGYAVRAADVGELPCRLPVVGAMAAGMAPDAVAVAAGTAAKVMTGAPLPQGADTVVPYEWTDRGREWVTIRERASLGHAVRAAGEDQQPGAIVLNAGHRIRPTDLAACAASGTDGLTLARAPRVAVITTGDELRPPGSRLLPGQIFDTAGLALEALVERAGGVVTRRLSLPDDLERVVAELRETAAAVDCVVTVGGVSVGDHDHVRTAVERLGRLHLWRVAMRPGRPLAVGTLGSALFLGLPGNPVSACVTFLLFGAPALLALQGASRPGPETMPAVLGEEVEKPEGLETFHRVVRDPEPDPVSGLWRVRPAGAQGSGITQSLALADALVALPAAGTVVPRGALVQLIPLG